ncbi:hypothetical protein CHCC20335_4580 [Bacillus paralicheniformis]|nr:hypothetical protein CHCC20335_4580 [Bacillus paralicheniformis]
MKPNLRTIIPPQLFIHHLPDISAGFVSKRLDISLRNLHKSRS